MQISRRPMTQEEQAKLSRMIAARNPGRVDDWVIGVLAPLALLFVPLLLLQLWLPELQSLEIPLILALFALGALLAIRLRRRRERTSGTGLLREDLRGNQAEVTRFDVARAEAVEAGGSQPPAYFLDTRDGHTLYLEGDYLRAPVAAGEFPARHVETIRTPLARVLLHLHCSGEAVAPDKIHPPFSPAERATGRALLDGDVLLPDDENGSDPEPRSV
jgi:hypothetical protein